MSTSITESGFDTSELDGKISEAESKIAMLQSQIAALEAQNADLIKKIANASINDAATYRQQYNANKNQIASLTSEKSNWESLLAQYNQYYRIPAIMQDYKTAYNLTWNGSGSWEGNTFVRTATMPNVNGVITFRATVSIARGPKYFLGIKIHRAIVQIAWTLTTDYSDTQVVAVLDLDPHLRRAMRKKQLK